MHVFCVLAKLYFHLINKFLSYLNVYNIFTNPIDLKSNCKYTFLCFPHMSNQLYAKEVNHRISKM